MIVHKAVGSHAGRVELNFEGTESTASVRKDWLAENRSSQNVEMTTIDSLIEEFGRPRLCKVDVEGFEVEVFNGMSQPIEVVCFELHRSEADRAVQVLKRLTTIGEITRANMTEIDGANWWFDEWLSVAELSKALHGPLPRAANAVVQMRV